jgi:ABC-2 type transport system permease protein
MSNPTTAVVRTEFRLAARSLGNLFWPVAFPAILLTILGLVPSFREPSPDLGGARVVDLYVSITILLSIIMAALQALPPVLTAYREQRVLRRYATTPAHPLQLLLAQFAVHAATVVAGAGLVLLVGVVAFDAQLPGAPGPYLLTFVLALVAMFAVGGLIAGTARSTRTATTVGSIVFIGSMFTAGVWFPVAVMPEALRSVVTFTPLGAAAQAMDSAAAGSWPELLPVLVLLVWAGGATALAVRYFRWE